ncbi:putative carboxymethylenebutenolidase [Colletotrichum spaethianum]|uniref:Carboxymethylenebutenolidase n=1 Tax=Colletotrichum spaethianum TaxID=700344 RepID=A0AA37LCA7_9PEZI|nr:putative carboxymethylenebutenolidase [Colletotrichum spaethianum]GKT45857.1 putative carboxymethylenebutenolidase [Colletotrichum spaethianum]
MASLPDPGDFSRFADFTILTTTYKIVTDNPIKTDVLIPKHLTSSSPPATTKSCPVILRYHGGGFIAASSLYPGFFQPWHMELAARHNAVIVTPNYRLVPEASIDELLEDIEDHWTWVQRELPAFVEKETSGQVKVDTGRILAAGDSAGGYLSIMAGLSHADKIRAVTAAYPCIDIADEHFMKGPAGPTLGFTLPRAVVDEHYDKMRKGELPAIISEDPRLERGTLMLAAIQYGVFSKLFPLEKRHLFPLERLRDGARFPRGGVFVWQGEQDSVVPAKGNVKFGEVVRELDPELEFRLEVREGEHGFDHNAKIDDGWMKDGLSGLLKAWLE